SEAVSGSNIYFHANSKSPATTGSPFDHFASSFNSNVYTVPSSEMSQSVATPGPGVWSSCNRVKPSIKLFNGSQDNSSNPMDGFNDVGSSPLFTRSTFSPSSPRSFPSLASLL